MKNLFKLLLLLGVTIYLGFAFVSFANGRTNRMCEDVKVTIADSAYAVFITPSEVSRLLQKGRISLVGQQMDSISCLRIEETLRKSSFVKEVTCYKTGGRTINIILMQRLPLLRVMADNGEDYYIDERGDLMQPQGYAADLPIVTGEVSQAFVRKRLLPLARFIAKDELWRAQVEQMHIDAQGRIDIVPRVGAQLIHFGKAEEIPEKFQRLRTFYEKVLPQVGWNKYSEISVAYTNQIICKKDIDTDL